MTQKDFAFQIGISSRMLQSIELGERRLSEDVVDAVYLLTGVTPESLKKVNPLSSLGGPFDFKKYQYWQTVRQNENEEGPKRVMKERVEALKWIGKAMEKTKRGLLWEEEFRRFLLKTILRYGISSELEKMKAELMAKGEKWPDEAFEAPKGAAQKAAIAAAIIKSQE
jgi:transcriptional regulator with XRE-family HTH domain